MHLNQPSFFQGTFVTFQGIGTPPPTPLAYDSPVHFWEPRDAPRATHPHQHPRAMHHLASHPQLTTPFCEGKNVRSEKNPFPGKGRCLVVFWSKWVFEGFCVFFFLRKKKQKMEKIEELPFLIFFMLKVNNHERSNGSMGQKLKAESEDFLHIQCVPRWLASA